MKTSNKIALMAASMVFASLGHATMITQPTVYEATNFNHGDGKHALWTNGDHQSNTWSADNLWLSVDHMGTSDVTDDVAKLYGGATSTGSGLTAHIDLTFSSAYTELDPGLHHYKKEHGLAYDDLMLNNPVFWSSVLGSITIGDKVYDVDRHVTPQDKSYTFQFGMGANAKNKYELGGSSWIQTCQRAESLNGASDCMESHHWDLNLGLKPVAVPEPGTIALLMAGVAGLLVSRKTGK